MLGRAGLLLKGPSGIQGRLSLGAGVLVDASDRYYWGDQTYGSLGPKTHMMDSTRGVIVYSTFGTVACAVPFTLAGTTITALTANKVVIDATTSALVHSTKLNDTEILVVYSDATNVNLKGLVITLNGDNTISMGAVTTIDTNGCYSIQVSAFSGTKVVCAYFSNAGWLTFVRALTVASKVVTAHAAVTGTYFGSGVSLATLDNTYALVGSRYHTSGTNDVRGVTLNGDNTVTLTSPVTFETDNNVNMWTALRRLTSTTAVLLYYASSGINYLKTVNFSGGTVTVGSRNATVSAIANTAGLCALSEADVIAVVDGSTRYAKVGTPFTFGTALSAAIVAIDPLDATHAICLGSVGSQAYAYVMTLS